MPGIEKTTRRQFLKNTAAASAGILSASVISPQLFAGEPDVPVKIGYLPITDATPLLIAHAKGYFKDEGLKVERPVRIRSWSALAESFLTGKFNLTHLLLPIPIWMRFNNKAPVKVMAWDHTNGSALTVRKDAGINGFADLGGKQLAVPYWYSMHNVILQMGLEKRGIKPVIQSQSAPLKPDEVNLFILPPPEMPAALMGKKIDGYIVAEPYNAVGEMKTGAKIMRFTGDIWKNHPCCVVVMNETLVEKRPVFTQKVINAVVRAQLYTINHMEEAAVILSRDGGNYLPAEKEIVLKAMTGYDLSLYGGGDGPKAIHHPGWNMQRIGFQPYPYPSATRFIVERLKKTLVEGDTGFLNVKTPDEIARELVDDRFVKKAIQLAGGPSKFDLIDLTRPFVREEVIEF